MEHQKFTTHYSSAFHHMYVEVRTRRVDHVFDKPCDEAQIEIEISSRKRHGSGRTSSQHGGMILQPGDARRMAVSLAPEIVDALKSAVESLEQLAKINRIPENMQGLREGRAMLELLNEVKS
jgi:hypothetical protein